MSEKNRFISKYRRRVCLFICMFLLLTGRKEAFAAGTASGSVKYAIAESSIRLFEKTADSEKGNKNLLISPDSVLSALMMVENGASGNTLSEMEKAFGGVSVKKYSQYLSELHKRIAKSKQITYKNSNSLWYKKGAIKIRKTYLKRAKSYFSAEIKAASFRPETVKAINQWVSEKTNGKIPRILSSISQSIRLIAINATYFKGAWESPYETTKRDTFTDANGNKKKVRMLTGQEKTYVNIAGADGFVKYYSGGQTAFMALLPPEGMSIRQYIRGLTGREFLNGYKNRMKDSVTVYTRLPEFKYDYSVSLKKPLKKLGIKKAFSNNADFSKMTDTKVCIDEVFHKTYIDLNKDGTEAAAATTVMVKAGSIAMPEQTIKKVYLNRPFVYAIIDTKTGLPLFIGAVNRL